MNNSTEESVYFWGAYLLLYLAFHTVEKEEAWSTCQWASEQVCYYEYLEKNSSSHQTHESQCRTRHFVVRLPAELGMEIFVHLGSYGSNSLSTLKCCKMSP